MKVVHVYRTYFPDPPGGLQEAIQQIALGTEAFGVDSKVFTLSPNPNPKKTTVRGIEVVRELSWASPASCDLGGIAAIRAFRELVQWADVMHFHFPWPYADILNFILPEKTVRVMTYHSDIVRQRVLGVIYHPLMLRTLKSMDAVVATSPNYLATSPVLSSFPSHEKLKVIPLGIADRMRSVQEAATSVGYLEKLGLAGHSFVLALGVLRYYKGLHYLIEAAAKIQAPIVIAGSGPEKERLQALVVESRLSNVIFAGQVSEGEKNILLQACSVFAFPSHLRSEAFGMVLVEAAMYSKPLVTCEIGSGMSYVNCDGVTGMVVPPESPEALASTVNRLLADPELATQMGQAARLRYENLFSGEVLGRNYTSLYRSLMDAKKHRVI